MKKFTYKNIKTGKTVTSDKPIKDKNLKLVTEIRGPLRKDKIINK